jgi:hypothetical protein
VEQAQGRNQELAAPLRNAADLAEHRLTYQHIKALRVFSGIGYIESSSLVLHVDVRHVGPNTTNGTPQRPTTWPY